MILLNLVSELVYDHRKCLNRKARTVAVCVLRFWHFPLQKVSPNKNILVLKHTWLLYCLTQSILKKNEKVNQKKGWADICTITKSLL